MPLSFDVDTHVPASCCCECGHELDGAAGPCKPKPGDFSLCINCGSLSVFDARLKLRKPTDEEYFAVAADTDIQALRRCINSMPNKSK